jgi:hypothetical protein
MTSVKKAILLGAWNLIHVTSFTRVGDTDLGEEEIFRLANLGSGSNKNAIIETLTKSLILRNKYIFCSQLVHTNIPLSFRIKVMFFETCYLKLDLVLYVGRIRS